MIIKKFDISKYIVTVNNIDIYACRDFDFVLENAYLYIGKNHITKEEFSLHTDNLKTAKLHAYEISIGTFRLQKYIKINGKINIQMRLEI